MSVPRHVLQHPANASPTRNGRPLVGPVNEAVRALVAPPQMPLAEHQGPLGHRIACSRGTCSALTVWLDGASVKACQIMAIEVGDRGDRGLPAWCVSERSPWGLLRWGRTLTSC